MEKPGVNGWHKMFSLIVFFDVIKANFVLEYVRTTLKWTEHSQIRTHFDQTTKGAQTVHRLGLHVDKAGHSYVTAITSISSIFHT